MAAKNKTQATEASVENYLAAIEDETRRKDCQELAALVQKVSKEKPKMWGTSIVGFGSRHYKYESGREGDTCVVGFASRKNDIAIYGLGTVAAEQPELLSSLGKYKGGKGCLYISRLDDVDTSILEKLIASAVATKRPAERKRGEFMSVKSGGKKFKGVAEEPDNRRK